MVDSILYINVRSETLVESKRKFRDSNNEIALSYLRDLTLEQCNEFKQRVEFLRTVPQPIQRTEEWFSAREKRITASEAADCLTLNENSLNLYREYFNLTEKECPTKLDKCANTYHSGGVTSYLIKKINNFYQRQNGIIPSHISSEATRWGQKYEEVALREYTLLTGDFVHEFGFICHPQLSWLGASPDGITEKGVMLEIKCPKSREITGVTPFHYFVQCQIQLECCDMEMCHFLECEMAEYTEQEWIDLKDACKGILIEYQTTESEKDCEKEFEECEIDPTLSKFKYLPLHELSMDEMLNWRDKTMEFLNIEYNVKLLFSRPIYYNIPHYNITSIPRMRDWFVLNRPVFEDISKQLAWLQSDYKNFIDFKMKLMGEEGCLL